MQLAKNVIDVGLCGFLDISDGLGDRAFQVDPDRRRLHDCRLVFRMSDAHNSSRL
jgi:hypothetical protein